MSFAMHNACLPEYLGKIDIIILEGCFTNAAHALRGFEGDIAWPQLAMF